MLDWKQLKVPEDVGQSTGAVHAEWLYFATIFPPQQPTIHAELKYTDLIMTKFNF